MQQRKEPQHVAWVSERDNGGRGFGFTGAHFHKNWANDDFRQVGLNAVAWIAGWEIPEGGVPSKAVPDEELHLIREVFDPSGVRKGEVR